VDNAIVGALQIKPTTQIVHSADTARGCIGFDAGQKARLLRSFIGCNSLRLFQRKSAPRQF
jgi:hypothetical protein